MRVLLVEDDPDNREALTSLLALSGCDVTPADTGAAAMRAFAAGRFDVVLTDLGLPDMNGWDVAGAIKRCAPATPVALVTGAGVELPGDEMRQRGIDLLLQKPLDPRSLVQQLEKLAHAGGRSPKA
jgi:CheY-like chemotaxis protein